MPIEIRELVIRAQVDPDPCGDSSQKQRESPDTASSNDREDIIRTCVQEVLRILEDKRER